MNSMTKARYTDQTKILLLNKNIQDQNKSKSAKVSDTPIFVGK